MLALALAAPVAAQEADHVFHPEYFARFSPRTAQDMLKQVPGFTIKAEEEARGLGQATSNVLINGQRISSKSDGAEAQLSRIPASNVLRIEIVDGATLQIPGLSGQVANVFVKSGGVKGQFNWRGEARAHFADPLFSKFDVSVSGKTSGINYTIGLSNDANRGAAGGTTRIETADGSLTELRDDVLTSNTDKPRLTAAFQFTGPGEGVGNINLMYRHIWSRDDETSERSHPGLGASLGASLGAGLGDRTRIFRQRIGGPKYEIGGDYEFNLGAGRLKLIGLDRYARTPYSQQTIFTYADRSPQTGDRYSSAGTSGEQVARAEYGWKMGGADWQISAEAAFNRLDSAAQLFSLDGSGNFIETPFPDGSGGVRETRYESILSYSRPLTSKLSLQITGGAEFSRLSQTGASAVPREFWRPKGSISLAWAPRIGLDLSIKLGRRVGQLDFGDFLAKVFLDSGNSNAGNDSLVPPQSWELDFEAKQNLGRWGSATLKLFDYRFQDYVEVVPIGTNGESPGNIDGARRQGLQFKGTVQLAPLGFNGAKLDLFLGLERSRIRDPLTGIIRPISETQNRSMEIDLRQDIPGSPVAWGVHFGTYHFDQLYRLREVGLQFEGPRWMGIFIEHKNVMGLTVNARAGNLLNARNRLDRIVYNGFRDRSPIAFIEHRNRLIGPIFSLSVKGNF
jgi:hypothetical protein